MSSNYVVMFVNIVIWAGVFFMLMRLDRKIKDLERNE